MDERPLSVAFFSDSALPVLNGVSVSIQSLIAELRNAGHSVTLFASGRSSELDDFANTHRFRALQGSWNGNYPIALPPFLAMLRTFRKSHFDLIHTHTPFVVGFVGLRWAESHDIPIVSTYHTLYDRYAHYVPFVPRRYVRFKIAKHTNFYYSRVRHVVTPSEAAAKWLRRHAVETPISVIPTGTPPKGFFERAEMRHRFGIPADQKVLLYVGRVAKEKNLPVLFEMTAKVMARDPSVRLWLVGDGPFRGECHEIVRALRIGDRVRFVGFVDRQKVDQYYAAADLFVFSSITETQGLVVQEAMAYGLPAVVVAGGGAGASLEPGVNGELVKNDADEFADAVLAILRDRDLYELLSAGASRSVRQFTTAAMADKMVQLYRDVLGGRSPSSVEGGTVGAS